MGVTTPTGGVESGLLVDADVEINSRDFELTDGASGATTTSVAYVLTHEIGHFLGLGHSHVPGALMSKPYQSVALSELLTEDDVAAICAVYPPIPRSMEPSGPLVCDEAGPPAYAACGRAPGAQLDCSDLASMPKARVDEGGCTAGSRQPARGTPALLVFLALLSAGQRGRRVTRKRWLQAND